MVLDNIGNEGQIKRKVYQRRLPENPNKDYYFVFGKETTGLPETFMREYYDRNLRIPMSDNIRCYNLSNSVAMVLLEALRQQGFPNMEKSHHYENDKLKDNYNRPERYERNLGEN